LAELAIPSVLARGASGF